MQSQGIEHQLSQKHASADREQLQRSAEMFEMILKTSPDVVENYLSLKDIYRQLKRDADYKRVTKGLARLYLNCGETEQAAREYADVVELDPGDEEALGKLREVGYTAADLPALQGELKLRELRNKHEQKSRELQEAEKVFLKANARARGIRTGEDNDLQTLLQAVEEQVEKEIQKVVTEHDRWITEGRTQLFNQVAESLKREADSIIQADELNNIRKSVKKAEKLLASTDRVFQEEWRRVSDERESEFPLKIQELRQKKEENLRSTLDEVIARAEQEVSTADLTLREIKEELRCLEAELKEKEKHLQKKVATSQPLPEVLLEKEAHTPEMVVAAPGTLNVPREDSDGVSDQPATPPAPKDEVGKTLGTILVQHGLVSREHLEEALVKQRENHRPIGQILVESGYAAEEDITNALVAQAGVPYLPLGNYDVSDEVAVVIPREVALKYAVMPVDRIANSLLMAMGIPLNREQKKEVQRCAGDLKINYFISSWSDIKAKHEQHYG